MTFTPGIAWAYQEVVSSSKLNLMTANDDQLNADVIARTRGVLDAKVGSASQVGSTVVGTHTTVSDLSVTGVVLTRNTRVRLSFYGVFSITGVGPNFLTVQLRQGATVVKTARIQNLGTNGNSDLGVFGMINLAPGTYSFSVTFAVATGSTAGVSPQFRGDISPGDFTVEDAGPW
jgi:hypothetical protein